MLAVTVAMLAVVIADAVRVVLAPKLTALLYNCVPLVVIAEVLIRVVPLTDKFLPVPPKVTVSLVSLPKTALPVMVNLFAPLIAPLNVAVVAIMVVSAKSVTSGPV